ncbi:MAG: hypothetical protein ACI9G9_001288 [Psychromonas sp.]|jgi:hypothetical protein
MKKALLSLCVFLGSTFGIMAQSITINEESSSSDISGTTYQLDISDNTEQHINFLINNKSGANMDMIVTRVNLDQPADWNNYLCFSLASDPMVVCSPSNSEDTWSTRNSVAIPEQEAALIQVFIQPGTYTSSPITYRYYFGTEENSKLDSIDVAVKSIASVSEINKKVSITLSPNPASNLVKVIATNVSQGKIKMIDVLGNVILNESFNGAKTINVNEYKNGVYFVIIEENGRQAVNRKLVVRH